MMQEITFTDVQDRPHTASVHEGQTSAGRYTGTVPVHNQAQSYTNLVHWWSTQTPYPRGRLLRRLSAAATVVRSRPCPGSSGHAFQPQQLMLTALWVVVVHSE